MITKQIPTAIERHRILVADQLAVYNKRLKAAIEAKAKRELLKIYDQMEGDGNTYDNAPADILEEHDALVDQANEILYSGIK